MRVVDAIGIFILGVIAGLLLALGIHHYYPY